ncbi:MULTISPECIES: hypothetical protein [unclassified Moorena]|uniref:hypothetical protein n=1 Tax=unclassified Moorena TaxID=2683338 RepID=UPI0013BC52C8|nr:MULTISPECIES: hypothetical protein [unclassified Moorena]NER92133.1 hypothetical protein [Moorena sp. SIO3A2]NES42356.1 hypothetical protein [Moorena sp. SIO2C4]NET64145.1 hypothetical protein [Moorena sp. SIO1G6]
MASIIIPDSRFPIPDSRFPIPDSLNFMDNDIVLFLATVGLLILYLVFSALTEMGTKFPWKK